MAAPVAAPYPLELVGTKSGQLVVDVVNGADPPPAIRAKLKQSATEVIQFLEWESGQSGSADALAEAELDPRWFDWPDPIPVPVHDLTPAQLRALVRSGRKYAVEPTPRHPTPRAKLPSGCHAPNVCTQLGPCPFAPVCVAPNSAILCPNQTSRSRVDAQQPESRVAESLSGTE
jgi:hypothetical protein